MKLRTLLSLFIIFSFIMLHSQGTGDTVRAIHIDEDDIMWLGTDHGLLRFDGDTWSAYNTGSNTPGTVTSIAYEDAEEGSQIWVGTDNGILVSRYDVDGITEATRYSVSSTNSAIKSNQIVDIEIDTSNTRFFATPVGMGVFEVDAWSWLELGWGPAESGMPVYEVLTLGSKNDTIYVGSIDRGAGRVINEVDGFSGASYYEQPWTGIIGNTVKSIYTDSDGYQWFGTTEGVSRHTTQIGRFGWDLSVSETDGLANNTVNVIFQDSRGYFWMGTENGLSKYDSGTGIFTNYTTSDGLPGNMIFDVTEDSDTVLWIGTDAGLSEFDGFVFTNYSTGEQAKDFINLVVGEQLHLSKETQTPLEVYPNPASSDVFIHYKKEHDAYMDVSVFDISGKTVKALYHGYAGGGDLKVRWNLHDATGSRVPAGIYFLNVRVDNMRYTSKVVVLR